MAEGLRRKEGKQDSVEAAAKLGLHMCDKCLRENVDSLKTLLNNHSTEERVTILANEVGVISSALRDDVAKSGEVRILLKRSEAVVEVLEAQKKQLEKMMIELLEISRDSVARHEENTKSSRTWSDLFKNKVELLATDMKIVQKSVEVTKSTIDINNDRQRRKNNIVAFNVPENETNSRLKDKEIVLKILLEVSGMDMEGDVVDVFRMGRRLDVSQKPRPLLIKLSGLIAKNLILENSFKLRRSELHKNVILSHDMSKEDREDCRKLLADKKREMSTKDNVDKWVFRLRGHPGEFHVVPHRRQNL